MRLTKAMKILVDIIMTVIFVVLLIPRIVDTSTHEFLGIAIMPIIAIHVLLNWEWVKVTVSNMWNRKATQKSRHMFSIVIGLLVSVAITIISGFALSEALGGATLSHQLGHSMQSGIMPAMAVHRISSFACMVYIFLHIRVHWNYIKAIFTKKGKR